MNIQKIVILVSLAVVAPGCASARWVSRQQAPYRGGQIQYLDAGLDSIVADRRDDAWVKMSEFCGGQDKFTVLRESKDGTNYFSYNGGLGMMNTIAYPSDDLTLTFKCEGVRPRQAAAN